MSYWCENASTEPSLSAAASSPRSAATSVMAVMDWPLSGSWLTRRGLPSSTSKNTTSPVALMRMAISPCSSTVA